jgi:hypothetical protein
MVSRDRGWLMSEIDEVSNIKIIDYIPDAVTSTIERYGINVLFEVILYAVHTDTVTYIKYSKIQDVLANLGGVINFCKLSWVILFELTNYFDMSFDLYCYTYLNNKNFTIKTEKENLQTNQTLQNNISNRSNIKTINTTNAIKQTITSKNNSIILFREYKFNLKTGFCKYICSRLTGNYKDFNKMDIMHNKIKKEMEVWAYLRMKEDIYLLKSIMFNPDETIMFNQIVDFRDVQRIFKDSSESNDVYTDYLKASYYTRKFDKNRNYSALLDLIRKLRNRFQSISDKPISPIKMNHIKENTYFKNNIENN